MGGKLEQVLAQTQYYIGTFLSHLSLAQGISHKPGITIGPFEAHLCQNATLTSFRFTFTYHVPFSFRRGSPPPFRLPNPTYNYREHTSPVSCHFSALHICPHDTHIHHGHGWRRVLVIERTHLGGIITDDLRPVMTFAFFTSFLSHVNHRPKPAPLLDDNLISTQVSTFYTTAMGSLGGSPDTLMGRVGLVDNSDEPVPAFNKRDLILGLCISFMVCITPVSPRHSQIP